MAAHPAPLARDGGKRKEVEMTNRIAMRRWGSTCRLLLLRSNVLTPLLWLIVVLVSTLLGQPASIVLGRLTSLLIGCTR